MKKFLAFFLSLFTCTVPSHAFIVRAQEPGNIARLTNKVLKYYSSGHYLKDVEKVDAQALSFLKMRLSDPKVQKNPSHFAVVFDADETLYSNAAQSKLVARAGTLAFLAFSQKHDAVLKYNKSLEPVVLQSTQKVFQFAKDHKLSIFILTANREDFRSIVEKRLKATHYSGWTKLILRPKSLKTQSFQKFKASVRQGLEKKGFHILANIGDQNSDLAGGYTEAGFKLPNAFDALP